MATNVYSASRFLVDDIIVGRGQLGYGYSTDVSANGTLWGLAKASKYNLNPTGANRVLTLPAVGTATSQAQPGHSIILRNKTGSGFNIDIQNSAAVSVVVLSPGEAAQVIADTAEVTGWYAVFNVPQPVNITNLQEAYNESGADASVPKIQLSAFGAVDIRDSATELLSALSVADSAGTYTHFNVGNGVAASPTPIITMLNGSAVGMEASMAVGGSLTTTGTDENTVLFARPTSGFTFADVSNTHITAFSTILKTSGDVQVGTTLTSPNEYTVFATNDATNSGAATVIPLVTMDDNTSYRVRVDLVGRDSDVASQISSAHTITALVSNLVAAGVVQGQSDLAFDTTGYTSPSVATLTAAGGVLSLNFTAADNVLTTMSVRVVTSYTALTIV